MSAGTKKRPTLGRQLLGGGAVALVVGAIIAAGGGAGPSEAQRKVVLSQQTTAGIGEAIRAAGFNCPAVTEIFAEGSDAYGNVAKVWCGHIRLRMTTRADGFLKVEPW